MGDPRKTQKEGSWKMTDRERIENLFKLYWDVAGEPLATATLVLAQIVTEAVENIDHRIALGIRYGLFGTETNSTASVDTAASRVGGGLEAFADAINNAKIKISDR